MRRGTALRLGAGVAVGIDLGSVTLKGVVLDSEGRILARHAAAASGALADGVGEVLSRLAAFAPGSVALGVTGSGKGAFASLSAACRESDLVAAARAAARLYPEVRGLIEVGGHESKWTRLSGEGVLESFSLNDQCAAGSGAFLEQQAGRLGLGIAELSSLAAGAERAAAIAGRCAVFAKSDMIHQQQKGTPIDELAYGLCLALARNFRATLLRGRSPALPALLLGGGGLNAGLLRAFRAVLRLRDEDLLVAQDPQLFAAHGVALAALELEGRTTLAAAAEFLRVQERGAPARGLPVLHRPDTHTLPEPEVADAGPVEAWLGVDVGSVSTDFCLLSPEGDVLDGIYLRTRGDPVGVLREGLGLLRARLGPRLRVLGVGTTGSGRHLAGRLLRADVVKNEITCQVLGASHALPEVDTILEIGGQDSKYVSVRDGRVAEFVMNKVCAAGTGSFLEEQGGALGVSILEEFSEVALSAGRPVDLGSQCTVFMDTEVVHARQRGTPLSDVLAGLAYSVARNYLERVVAGRPIGEQVVFQGGVASNAAVVAAFEVLLGKPMRVHPHNRISGAIGAALAARDGHRGEESSFAGLDAVDSVQVRTFECQSCANLCQVSRIRVGDDTAYFGDTCERYTARDAADAGARLPDLVEEVEELLESYAGGHPYLGTAGIPRALMMLDLLPFWATFLRTLGFSVVLSGPSTSRVLEEGLARLGAEVCLPIKLVHGHVASLVAREDIDLVLLPSILDLPDCADGRCHLCPFEESVGFMVAGFAGERLVVPALSLTAPRPRLVRELRDKLQSWDLSEERIGSALDAAYEAQDECYERLRQRGREVLDADFGLAFVLIGKPYNILDPFENLNLAHHVRKLGILPIPMQLLPEAQADLKALGFTVPWHYDRGILRALSAVRGDARLYPVVVTNFGCGPDAFSLRYLEELTRGRPCLLLEFDEHRGEAGLITRLEAFIDEVEHDDRPRRSRAVTLPPPPQRSHRGFEGKRFVLPHFADHAWAYQGALRFAGNEAVVLPPPDQETLEFGAQASTGTECHPYTVLAGDLLKHVEAGTISAGDVFLFPGTTVACLLSEYGSAMRQALGRRGVRGVEVVSPGGAELFDILGMPAMVRLGRGLLACDLLAKLHCQVRPYAEEPGRVDALFEEAFPRLAEGLAKDRVGEALRHVARELEALPRRDVPRRPLVGVAGDVYTRIHPFGNQGLFRRLEELGLEVWPAPFLVDSVEFGWRREMSEHFEDGRYLESAATGLLFLRKEMEALRVRLLLGTRVERATEPGYDEVLELAGPYLDRNANELVLLNTAKMVDFVRRGAHGVINAISFHCMLGTVSASLTERLRRDHDMVPITTVVYGAAGAADVDAKLEAFAHQVREFSHKRPRPDSSDGWLSAIAARWR